jgi:hypothetical protein
MQNSSGSIHGSHITHGGRVVDDFETAAEELAVASVALPAVGFLCGPENTRKKSNHPNS